MKIGETPLADLDSYSVPVSESDLILWESILIVNLQMEFCRRSCDQIELHRYYETMLSSPVVHNVRKGAKMPLAWRRMTILTMITVRVALKTPQRPHMRLKKKQ